MPSSGKNKSGASEKPKYQVIRNCKVIKSNSLIQKSKFELSVQEQKIMLYLISKIKPNDDVFITSDFEIIEFCEVCGIESDNGQNYKNIQDTIGSLAEKILWVHLDNGDKTILRWIDKPYINDVTGKMRVKLDDLLKPFLLHLKNNFTQFELINTLAMKSKYSIRLYELLRSYEYKKFVRFDIDELKKLLYAEHYERYIHLRTKVIDVAVNEINNLSDLNVSYMPVKESRKFTGIEFTISLKIDFDERFAAWKKIQDVIGN